MGVLSLCQEGPLEEGMTTHPSVRGTWRALVHGAEWANAKDYNRRCAGFVEAACRKLLGFLSPHTKVHVSPGQGKTTCLLS